MPTSDLSKFDCEEQDTILAGMQRSAQRDFAEATSIADRASATAAFADASRARRDLVELIGRRRRREIMDAANRKISG